MTLPPPLCGSSWSIAGWGRGRIPEHNLAININVISNQPHPYYHYFCPSYLYHLHYQSHLPLRMKLDILSPIIFLSDVTVEPDLFGCWVKLKGEAPQRKQFLQRRWGRRWWWWPTRRSCWNWSSSWTSGASRASPGPCWEGFWKLIQEKNDKIKRICFDQCVQSWCRLNRVFFSMQLGLR